MFTLSQNGYGEHNNECMKYIALVDVPQKAEDLYLCGNKGLHCCN
jgi:hypothetical protein